MSPAQPSLTLPPRTVSVTVRYPGLRPRPAAMQRLVAAIETAAGHLGWKVPAGELCIALLDEPEHSRLHAEFCGDPSPTDVITFPGDASAHWAGDICLSLPCAQREAARRGRPPAAELALYLVHGWLHLAGFDDHAAADRRAMRAAERRLLAGIPAALIANAFPTLPVTSP